MTRLTIYKDKCKGCGLCVKACPKDILIMSKALNKAGMHYAECINMGQCLACKSCGVMCPDGAITIEKI